MKIADKRHHLLDGGQGRTPAWMHHILCDCGETFGHEPDRGAVCTCPSCGRSENVSGADLPTGIKTVIKDGTVQPAN
jgi:hypothetical protein